MTENPLEQAAIAVAEEGAAEGAGWLEQQLRELVANHAKLRAELDGVHHFLTVFADHLKSRGVDITAQLPKIVTGDDLHPIADATPTADANTPAAAGAGPAQ
jgi:hypothetical protein